MDTDTIQGNPVEPTSEQAQQQVEGQQLPEPMPSSNQKPTEGDTNQQLATEGEELSLPEDASDRTRKNFEKIREENRKLKEQLASKGTAQYGSSVFDAFRGGTNEPVIPQDQYGSLNQSQTAAIAQQFVDQEGNVDINGLNQALLSANQRAEQAERRSYDAAERVTRFEETQQVREAHAVFPQLDPESVEFDPEFFDMVRDRMLRYMYEGKNQSLLDAATGISNKYKAENPVNVAKVEEAAVEKFKQTQELRNQGPIEQGRGEPRQTQGSLDELKQRTRQGDDAALTERMRSIGLIK
jgi:hypothetical protein